MSLAKFLLSYPANPDCSLSQIPAQFLPPL